MAEEFIIELRHVTKRFPGIVANDDISLGIRKGEIFALLGENGAGKSTLMSMIFGMYEPDEGQVYIRGKEEHIASPNHATKLGIGMVHQHFKLISNYTITENILLGTEAKTKVFGLIPVVDIKGSNQKIQTLSQQYGLEVNPTSRIQDINVSTQQRVEILKMLYREAEILIFDEPTAVLTPSEIEALLEIIKSLRDSGKTIILITHKLEEIRQVADRCAILNHGKLIDVLDVATTSPQQMANLMVGREVEFSAEKRAANPADVVLNVQDLTVRNKDKFPVVKSVSLSVRSGEIVAVAGVAGNGQVDLADAIAGLTAVHKGTVTLNGQDITHTSVRTHSQAGVSYVPEDRQSVGLVLDSTLAENLALKQYFKEPFCKGGLLKPAAFRSHSERLIQGYDIRSGQGSDTQVRSMSGGNQQKAIIAREIDQGTPLMIFVQPTRGLDIGAIENIHRQILDQRDRGAAILLFSLELEEIMSLADTIAVMYSGEILKIAPADSLTANQVGQYMMGVKES